MEYHLYPKFWRCISVVSFDKWNDSAHWEENCLYSITVKEHYTEYVKDVKKGIQKNLGILTELTEEDYEKYRLPIVKALADINNLNK